MAKKNLAALGLAGFATALFGATLLGNNVNAQEFVSNSYTLSEPVSDGIVVNEGQTVTIDLGGQKISNTTGKAVIINKGTLIITGEGEVSTNNKGVAAVTNYPGANLTLEGGTYFSTQWYTIRNYGEMTLGGNVVVKNEGSNTGNASMVTNGWVSSTDKNNGDAIVAAERTSDPKLTINGGTFTAGLTNCSVIKNDDFGNLVINGGNFKQAEGSLPECDAVVLNWNNAEINDGEFFSENGPVLTNGAFTGEADKGQLIVNGGTYKTGKNGEILGYGIGGNAVGKISLKAGTYDKAPVKQTANEIVVSGGVYGTEFTDASMIAAGYKAVENTDGKYEVALNVPASGNGLSNIAGGLIGAIVDAGEIMNGKEIKNDNFTFIVTDASKLENALSGELKLNVETITATVNAEDEALIDEALPEGATKSEAYDAFVVLRDENDNILGQVTELSDKVKLTFNVTANEAVKEGYKRVWKVVRIHNRTAEVLDAEYDAENGVITTESDKYSLFAPFYLDVLAETPKDDEPAVPETPNTGIFTDQEGKGTEALTTMVLMVSTFVAIALLGYAVKANRK